jgi:WD40 repeat protein
LEEPPLGEGPALVVTRPAMLPFEQLTPDNFEKLVLRLARLTGDVEHAQQYGEPGQSQHGIDLYCRLKKPGSSGRWYAAVQCRNVARTTSIDIAAAVKDFLGGAWARRTDTFVYATRVPNTRTERAEAIEAAASRLRRATVNFVVWDGAALSDMLRGLPELVDQFFARDTVRQFCGLEAVERSRDELDAGRLRIESAREPPSGRMWAWAGPEARGHFTRRAYGLRSSAQHGGDLFRGRGTAVGRIISWFSAPECPGEPLVVIGQPGSGKSAVVGRAVLQAQGLEKQLGLAVHARGLTVADLLAAVARLTGHSESTERFELVESLCEMDRGRVWPIVVDALDEAHSSADRSAMAELLVELAAVPCLRVVVATRPIAVEDRYAPGTLLRGLMITSSSSTNLVDLDSPDYFDRQSVVEFAAALLAQEGVSNPGPPGRAWQSFRADTRLAARLAGLIAERAGKSFLVAALAAYGLSTAKTVLDPAADGFVSTSIPASVSEAIVKYLDTLPSSQRVRDRGLLTALAYARGAGLEDAVWIRLAAALGYPATVATLDELRNSTAADYLLQTSSDGDGEPVTRLFHQALADDLLAARQARRAVDERAVLAALTPAEPAGWHSACRYALAHAAEHAEAADRLPDLLHDPYYLTATDLDRLLPALSARMPRDLRPTITVLHRAASRARSLPAFRCARLLALTAAHLGHHELFRTFSAIPGDQPILCWAHRHGSPHQQLTGHDGVVYTVALGSLGGRDVVVSGGFEDGTLLVRDAAGQLVTSIDAQVGVIRSVAVGSFSARDVIVCGGSDGMSVWDANGRPVGGPFDEYADRVAVVAVGSLGGRDVIVCGGDGISVWDADAQLVGGPIGDHASQVTAVAVGSLGGRDVIVSGGADGVLVWAADGHSVGGPISHHPGWVETVAIGQLGDRDVIVSAGGHGNGALRAWDANGQLIVGPLTVPFWAVNAVALGVVGGRNAIVTAGGDGTIRVWDADGRQVCELPDSRERPIAAVAVGRLGDRDVIVSSGEDSSVRIWDIDTYSVGEPLMGHDNSVGAMAVGRVGGREVIVTGDYEGVLRLWETDGHALGEPIDSQSTMVTAVALSRFGDRVVLVSGGSNGSVEDSENTLCIWDVEGRPVREPVADHGGWVYSIAIGWLDGREVLVSAGGDSDTALCLWGVDGQPLGEPLGGHDGWAYAVAIGQCDGRDVIVSGGQDGTVRIWSADGRPIGEPLRGHTEAVLTVAIGRVGGCDVIVSGGEDGTVRIWRSDGSSMGDPLRGHVGPVEAVAVARVHGRDVIVSGGRDGTVRIADFDQTRIDVIDLLESVTALSLVASSATLYVASGPALSRWQL